MSHLRALPELVRDSQLDVIIQDHITVHTAPLECRDSTLPQYWETRERLGFGGDGVVFLQQKTAGPGNVETLAVKRVMLRADLTSEDHDSKRYLRELEALAKFAQRRYARFFVKSYGWYQHQHMLYICMENCKHLDLGKYLKTHTTLSEGYVRTIALQVSQGLRHMHDNEIAHRDLKPANILIHRKPPEDDQWWVVLGDLGLSRRSGASSGTTTIRGTPNFMAPETMGKPFEGSPTDANLFSADMWCLGETISCALTGRGTFSDNDQLLQYQRYRMSFPDDNLKRSGASTLAIGFVRSLMEVDPSQRLTAVQAPDHPWFMVNAVEHTRTTVASVIFPIDESTSGTSRNQIQASPIQDLNDEAVVSDKREIPTLTQTAQASGQWTETVSIRTEDTQTSGMWTETVALPAMRKGNSSLHDRFKIPPWNPNRLQSQDSNVEGSPEQRDIANIECDLLGSFSRFSAAEKLRVSERKREFAHKDTVVKLDDLKKFSENFKLSTPVPKSLVALLTKDESKQRDLYASSREEVITYKRKIRDGNSKVLRAPDSPALETTSPAPRRRPHAPAEKAPIPKR